MQDLVVNERLTIPSRDLRWRFSRSSGPGGQGVNTTDSRVELVLDVANCSCLGPFRRDRLLEHFETRLVERLVVWMGQGMFPSPTIWGGRSGYFRHRQTY